MKEELKLKYTCTGGPYGDCMASYDVTFNRPCTLGEFVDAIIENKGEWGEIRVGKSGCIGFPSFMEYKYGKIISSTFTEDNLRKKIIKVDASYGWTCGNYRVVIE